MDIATLAGILSGVGLVCGSILMGSSLTIFINIPSLLITVGGTIASLLINFPLPKCKELIGIIKNTLFHESANPEEEIQRLVDFANVARREGLLALEEKLDTVVDPFTQKGLRLVIDGVPAESVRNILTIDNQFLHERHVMGKKMVDAAGAAAPAFGMIGTLIGLVQMLQNLSDPSQIGVGMATALLTTFYGAVIANLFCIPLAGKLDARNREETLMREILVEGILSILAGDKPQLVQEKLKSFVSPGVRTALETSD